jgi:hypothetical protein
MAVRHSHLISVLVTLFLCAMLSSCLKAAGPGLIPPEADDGYGQWVVLSTGFSMVKTDSGATRCLWQIVAQFSPEPAAGRLKMLDIVAAVDGVQTLFTFEEKGQIFKCVVTSPLEPGAHSFELKPSPGSSRPFPTLVVEFEAP